VSLKVFEQTPTQRFLILPPRIDEGELLERDLEAVTGGAPRGGGGACVAPTNSCALNTG
jgi:hypothetical protein